MKNFLAFLIILTVFGIPQVYADCNVSEDWPDAPCLDTVVNGYYEQHEVNQWAEYYQYKGTAFMEQKRAEMNQAIDKGNLKEWIAESEQNRNAYSYYYFSGRAPDIEMFGAQFDEFIINERSTIHDPYTDDERYQIASQKVPLGGLGINLQFDYSIMVSGIAIGAGLIIGLLVYWRKRK